MKLLLLGVIVYLLFFAGCATRSYAPLEIEPLPPERLRDLSIQDHWARSNNVSGYSADYVRVTPKTEEDDYKGYPPAEEFGSFFKSIIILGNPWNRDY